MFLCFCNLFDIKLGKDNYSELDQAVMVEMSEQMRYLDYETCGLSSQRLESGLEPNRTE
jgi:hypothetical protein